MHIIIRVCECTVGLGRAKDVRCRTMYPYFNRANPQQAIQYVDCTGKILQKMVLSLYTGLPQSWAGRKAFVWSYSSFSFKSILDQQYMSSSFSACETTVHKGNHSTLSPIHVQLTLTFSDSRRHNTFHWGIVFK